MDIEGAEKEVLKNSKKWINKVSALFVESHDRLKPGCSKAVDLIIKKYYFDKFNSGEYDVLIKLEK